MKYIEGLGMDILRVEYIKGGGMGNEREKVWVIKGGGMGN